MPNVQLPLWTALATLLVSLLLSCTAGWVGIQRLRTGVRAPAVSGDERFERALRIQMNTQEGALAFLPSLWVCALFLDDRIAAALAVLWICTRIGYALAYWADPAGRRSSFLSSQALYVVTWISGAAGVLMRCLS